MLLFLSTAMVLENLVHMITIHESDRSQLLCPLTTEVAVFGILSWPSHLGVACCRHEYV